MKGAIESSDPPCYASVEFVVALSDKVNYSSVLIWNNSLWKIITFTYVYIGVNIK